jgi:hypothetical protein
MLTLCFSHHSIMMTVENLVLQQDFRLEEDIAIFLSIAIEDCDMQIQTRTHNGYR